jgi:hypothetical protein
MNEEQLEQFIARVFEITYSGCNKGDYLTCECHKETRKELRKLFAKLKENK